MQEDGKIVVEGYAANGLLKGREFFGSLIADVPNPMGITLSTRYLHTPTALVRKSVLALARQKYRDIFLLALSLGDTTLWYAISSLSDVYYLPNITAVYRVHAGGVSVANRGRVMVDANLVRALFLKAVYKVSDAELIQLLVDKMIFAWLAMQGKWSDVQSKKALEDVSGLPLLGQIFRHPRFRLFRLPFVARAKALIVRKVAFYFFFHFMKDGNCANMFKRYDLNSRWTTEG